MPRRKGQVALHTALSQGWVGLRFLLRNPEFRQDLASCYNLEEQPVNHEQTLDLWALIKKWELAWLPIKWPKKGPGTLSEVVRIEEEFLIREMRENKEDPDINSRFIFRLPVETWDPDEVQEGMWIEANLEEFEEKGTLPRPPSLKPTGRFLMIRVNLSYPQDVLEEVIKLELNKAKRKRLTQRRKESNGSGKSRHRLDKSTLQLQIFDHITEGEKFTDIASKLKKPVSTVKSLYLAVSRKIFNPSVPKLGHKDVPLVDFDPETHVQKCSTCQSARSFEKMCKLAQTYACQPYKSQRERTHWDVDEIPSQKGGRTHKKKIRTE